MVRRGAWLPVALGIAVIALPGRVVADTPVRPVLTILGPPASGGFWRPQMLRAEGSFVRTLYQSLDLVLPDSILNRRERAYMAWELADVFRWDIDFTRGFHPGDQYRLVFERLISADGEIRYGRLLAAELSLGGRDYRAYEFDEGGRTAYFDEAGRSLRRSFLQVPVEFKRISSEFGERFHPILRRWRNHQGIDYAAESGSPVMAVGDGIVTRAGWAGGYGRLVEVRHGDGAVTRYAHLRGFGAGIRSGVRVVQGQCIGYVGRSGLATGPHLHFEFLLNGVPTDPKLLAVGTDEAVSGGDLSDFRRQVAWLDRVIGREMAVVTVSSRR